MKEHRKKAIIRLSNLGYIAGCIILYMIALSIIGLSIVSLFSDIRSGSFTVYKLLDEVALLVFSIAVIDVTKYLMIEEVLRENEERDSVQERRALTKFAVIIATALSLEGLVLTIELAKADPTQMIYPMGLLAIAILFIIGIGVYQYLSRGSDN